MGGKALSAHVPIRLTRSNYARLAADCVARLRAAYPGTRIEVLGNYLEKADFGDCDILIESFTSYDPHQAAGVLDAVEVVRNGPVTSIGVVVRPEVPFLDGNVFQVDLIRMEPEAFDFALAYFGRGDAGNLLGRIAHAMGVSLRHDGLFYIFRDGDYKFREILLTREFDEALVFLGYEPAPYREGFKTIEDIYTYVIASPFFDLSIFQLENRNAKSRVRDRKRPMYMGFLSWAESRPDLGAFTYPEDKAAWHARIEAHFPHFRAAYDQALADLAELRAVKEKFNGAWVSALTGRQGKALGALMQHFKAAFDSNEALRAYVLSHSEEDLKARVMALHNTLDQEGAR